MIEPIRVAQYLRMAVFGHKAPALTEKNTIVLADFTNATGDPVFDDTLRQELSIQLEQFSEVVLALQVQPSGSPPAPEPPTLGRSRGLSDGPQSMDLAGFAQMMAQLRPAAEAAAARV